MLVRWNPTKLTGGAPQHPGRSGTVLPWGRGTATRLGHVADWSPKHRREVSDRITLAATGSRQTPSFTVVDSGEGQTPGSMPNTLLSLDQKNKIDIHFVQGKFNMGGTGALRFCGKNNLQLVISRRNPSIQPVGTVDGLSHDWGFSVVRRENPTGAKRVSTYRYLAPEAGGVLHFSSDTLPLFPQGNDAYVRDTSWGTAIKLYEYKLPGKSHILRRDGLLYRLDILLPGIALPVRLHECRDFGGHRGSFDTTLSGLGVRLSDDRSDNLEPGFPTSSTFAISGQRMTAEVYAFRREKADSYRKNEGVVFTVNGQTHGHLSKAFFSRKSVGMNRLGDSLLVIVDCSGISGRHREDLFMNSRDRMEQGEFLRAIERELESILKDNRLLRDLREHRRREDVEAKLQDSKPFKDVLESILRKSPSLATLFGATGPLSNPFKSAKGKIGSDFRGKRFPSFFRFRNMDYGKELQRTTALNARSRIMFETDVVNDYFSRGNFAGSHILRSHDPRLVDSAMPDHTLNLQNGVATLNLTLPVWADVNDQIRYELVVEDATLVEPFVNSFVIGVGPSQGRSGGGGNHRQYSDHGTGDEDMAHGLAIPTPILVYEAEWSQYAFDKSSALKAVYDPPNDEEGTGGSHTYYINMDNVYLKAELRTTKESPAIVKARWQYGLVLVAMALLREQTTSDEGTVEDEVYGATKAIAPVLLPLIQHLGGLSDEDIADLS